jgi:hypothetical protein
MPLLLPMPPPPPPASAGAVDAVVAAAQPPTVTEVPRVVISFVSPDQASYHVREALGTAAVALERALSSALSSLSSSSSLPSAAAAAVAAVADHMEDAGLVE